MPHPSPTHPRHVIINNNIAAILYRFFFPQVPRHTLQSPTNHNLTQGLGKSKVKKKQFNRRRKIQPTSVPSLPYCSNRTASLSGL